MLQLSKTELKHLETQDDKTQDKILQLLVCTLAVVNIYFANAQLVDNNNVSSGLSWLPVDILGLDGSLIAHIDCNILSWWFVQMNVRAIYLLMLAADYFLVHVFVMPLQKTNYVTSLWPHITSFWKWSVTTTLLKQKWIIFTWNVV